MSTNFKFKMRTTSAIIAATLAGTMAFAPVSALACTQVYVGPELTQSGDIIWGRSEDAANRYAKAFGVEPATQGKTYRSYENGEDQADNFYRVSPGATYRYTYVRDTPSDWETGVEGSGVDAYSEAGTNEKGVSVSATLSTSMNKKIAAADPTVDAGIGEYNVTDVLLSEASTAREGVQLLGSIIDKQGSQGCNQIMIGDSQEVWDFMQLSGHEWIAVKIADDVASLNPNMSHLQFSVDIDNPDVCLHSAGLISTAEKAGALKADKNGTIDIARSYGAEDDGNAQNTRYVQGHLFLQDALKNGTDYETAADGSVSSIANPQLFFKLDHKGITAYQMMRLLGARGEGTDVDANANPELYAIGNNRTVEGHIFDTRKNLDPTIATVQWEALSRNEFSVFIPSYSALLTQVDENLFPNEKDMNVDHVGYENENSRINGKRVYDPKKVEANDETAMTDAEHEYMNYVMSDLSTLAYNHRDTVADGVHEYLDVLQQDIISQQDAVDKKMRSLPAEQRTDFANKAHATISNEVWTKSHDLLNEVRSYIKGTKFSDVDYAQYYGDGVNYLSARGIMNGYDGGTSFGVGHALKRGELATLLWNIAEPEDAANYDSVMADTKNETGMSDVKDGQYYTAAANWAVKNGVIHGKGGTSFDPEAPVTTQEFVTILANFTGNSDKGDVADLAKFDDGPQVEAWAQKSAAWAQEAGVVSGYANADGSRSLKPTESVNRERAAAILTNACKSGVVKNVPTVKNPFKASDLKDGKLAKGLEYASTMQAYTPTSTDAVK